MQESAATLSFADLFDLRILALRVSSFPRVPVAASSDPTRSPLPKLVRLLGPSHIHLHRHAHKQAQHSFQTHACVRRPKHTCKHTDPRAHTNMCMHVAEPFVCAVCTVGRTCVRSALAVPRDASALEGTLPEWRAKVLTRTGYKRATTSWLQSLHQAGDLAICVTSQPMEIGSERNWKEYANSGTVQANPAWGSCIKARLTCIIP